MKNNLTIANLSPLTKSSSLQPWRLFIKCLLKADATSLLWGHRLPLNTYDVCIQCPLNSKLIWSYAVLLFCVLYVIPWSLLWISASALNCASDKAFGAKLSESSSVYITVITYLFHLSRLHNLLTMIEACFTSIQHFYTYIQIFWQKQKNDLFNCNKPLISAKQNLNCVISWLLVNIMYVTSLTISVWKISLYEDVRRIWTGLWFLQIN